MKSKIKLSIVDTKYESNGKTYVKCILTCYLIHNQINIKQPLSKFVSKFVGEAVLKDDDKFDYQIGSKIALAKAERKAYKVISKILKEEYEDLFNLVKDLDNFIYKSESIVKHNTEYIKKLSNKGSI